MDASYRSARAYRSARNSVRNPACDPAFELAFDRAATDLQDIVHVIAARYLMRGVPLTWRLLHEIETEALADLGLASRHDDALLALFVRPGAADYPCTDAAVDLQADDTVPLLFWFALDIYGIAALSSKTPPPAARGFVRAPASAQVQYG